jgi:hypothetical protein
MKDGPHVPDVAFGQASIEHDALGLLIRHRPAEPALHVLASFDLGEPFSGLVSLCRRILRRGLVLNDGILCRGNEVLIVLLCQQFDEVVDIIGFFKNG